MIESDGRPDCRCFHRVTLDSWALGTRGMYGDDHHDPRKTCRDEDVREREHALSVFELVNGMQNEPAGPISIRRKRVFILRSTGSMTRVRISIDAADFIVGHDSVMKTQSWEAEDVRSERDDLRLGEQRPFPPVALISHRRTSIDWVLKFDLRRSLSVRASWKDCCFH